LNSIDSKFEKIRSNILDNVIAAALGLSSIALVFAIVRIFEYGFKYTNVWQIASFIITLLFFIKKDEIGYKFKFFVTILMFTGVGISGLLNFGLFGNGIGPFICAAVFSAVFYSANTVRIVIGVSIAIILTIGALFVKNVLTVDFDPTNYLTNYHNWMLAAAGYLFFSGSIAIITISLVRHLYKWLSESERYSNDLLALNSTLESKVKERTVELENSDKERNKILGTVAHDVRNQLGAVIGFLELIQSKKNELSEHERDKYLQLCKKCGQMSLDIVTDLANLSKTNSDLTSLKKEEVDLNEFIQSTIDGHLPACIKKQINLNFEKNTIHTHCLLDVALMSRAVDNLVNNAIKFTPRNGEICIELDYTPSHCVIVVKDSGIGIPPDLQKEIFEPFSKSGRPGTENEKSTGLGMTIVQKIVEAHGGKISLESHENKGSTFTIEIPKSS